MLKSIVKNIRKNKEKFGHGLVLGLALSMAIGTSAYALNDAGDSGSGNGNKPLSFVGYEYVSTTAIDVFFDKAISDVTGAGGTVVIPRTNLIDMSMFSITPIDGGNSSTVSGIDIYANEADGVDSDTTDTGLKKGTRVRIGFNTALSTDKLYNLTIKGTLMDKNGITLGNYYQGNDLAFTLRTPSSGTTTWADHTPYVTLLVGNSSSDVSYESNATLVFDRPISTGSLSTFISNLGFTNNTDSGSVPGHEAYAAISNNKNSLSNTFYFPMTKQGSTSTIYNRHNPGTNQYTISIPSFTDISSHTYTSFVESDGSNNGTFTFSTVSADYPGWENTGNPLVYLGVSRDGDTVTVTIPINESFSIDPDPAYYKVYYIEATGSNKWASLTSWSDGGNVNQGGGTTVTKDVDVDAGKTYWFRVVPYNSANKPVGPSICNQTDI